MMNLIAMMRDVHENAKAHGWWDGKRTERGCRALIVSEWAEALEEARAGRPMVWHACKGVKGDPYAHPACEHYWDCVCKMDGRKEEECPDYLPKPEGIAVELMDGCIRILDWLGNEKYDHRLIPETMEKAIETGKRLMDVAVIGNVRDFVDEEIPKELVLRYLQPDVLVDLLTEYTMKSTGGYGRQAYVHALCIACAWVAAHGEDPEKLMLEKHEYNKGRPYKHGKVF